MEEMELKIDEDSWGRSRIESMIIDGLDTLLESCWLAGTERMTVVAYDFS